MATWKEEVGGCIDSLRGRTVARLHELAANPPTGADAIEAWNELEKGLELSRVVDPVQAARNSFTESNDDRAGALERLVRSLAVAVDEALDGGINCEVDAIIRGKDVTLVTIGGGRYAGWKAAKVDPVKNWIGPNTPGIHDSLRTVPVYVGSDGTRLLLLGKPLPRFLRRSTIIRINTGAADVQAHEAAEAERVRVAEQAQREEAAARLERQAKELRAVNP